MPDKQYIIDNVLDYNANQLVEYIKKGIVNVNEILEENPDDFQTYKRIEVEENLWNQVSTSNDIKQVNIYLKNYPDGKFSFDAKTLIDSLEHPIAPRSENEPPVFEKTYQEPIEQEQVDPWIILDKNDKLEVLNFIESYPEHPKNREARKRLFELEKNDSLPKGKEWLKSELSSSSQVPGTLAQIIIDAIETKRITNKEIKELFTEDHNFLPFPAVQMLVEDGYIMTSTLLEAGIDEGFINIIRGHNHELIDNPVNTDFMENPDSINQVCQEVYFWGMPSSGKTCALGAILSAAGTGRVAKTIEKNPECRGYDYMRQLSEIFQPNKISTLPTGTSASFVSDMSFWLLDQKDRLHSITMVDLAGEMLHAMYLVDQGRFDELNPNQQTGYMCMKNLLVDHTSKNSKIHFFVLEYGGHERKEKGIRQVDMLDGALSHIKTLGILKNTDAVYLLITKADKAYKEGEDLGQTLKNYVKDYYQAFYNNLKLNTKNINGGVVDIIPFSIGQVTFKDLCRFDDEAANEVVNLFLNRTVGEKTGKWGLLNKTLRK